MLKYCHLAGDDFYLENGYTSSVVCGEEVYSYAFEEKLELAIAKHLALLPKPLNGAQLRFLRRSLGISQDVLAKHIERDAQTVARLEKSKDAIPRTVELTIRLLFLSHFSPNTSLTTLSGIIGRDAKVPNARFVFSLSDGEWSGRYHIPGIAVSPTRGEFLPASEVIGSGMMNWVRAKVVSFYPYSIVNSKSDFQNTGFGDALPASSEFKLIKREA